MRASLRSGVADGGEVSRVREKIPAPAEKVDGDDHESEQRGRGGTRMSSVSRKVIARCAAVLTAGVIAIALAACGGASSTPISAQGPATSPADGTVAAATLAPGTVTVFAASSLTDVFDTLAAQFENAHPGVTVVINYGGSSGLASQLVAGAPADVFAAASPTTMTTVVDAGLITATTPATFASNTLEIAVPAGNPANVTSLRDFGNSALRIAICAPEVPCGAIAGKAFAAAGIRPAPDTLEQDVKSVLTKVALGEVDAGLVYRTDILSAVARSAATSTTATIEGIEFAGADAVVTRYPIAALRAAPNAAGAAAFIEYVCGTAGEKALSKAGFGPG